MLEHARTGQGALLGHVADEQHRDPVGLGDPHDLARRPLAPAPPSRRRSSARRTGASGPNRSHTPPAARTRSWPAPRAGRSRRRPGSRARPARAAARRAAGSAPPTPRRRRTACDGRRPRGSPAPSSSAWTCRSPAHRRSGSATRARFPRRARCRARRCRSRAGRAPRGRCRRAPPVAAPARPARARAGLGLARSPDLLDERVPLPAARTLTGPARALVAAGAADVDGGGAGHDEIPRLRSAPDGSGGM